jgi:uncharacterized ferritin-like protein (DUF455 family)
MLESPLVEPNVVKKIALARSQARAVVERPREFSVPGIDEIARDIEVTLPANLPKKKGLTSPEGQARLVHDLASIELQAMELMFRTLAEYPDAPEQFREELCAMMVSEADHLDMCLDVLDTLGFRWGFVPAHIALWQAVRPEDSLIDRVVIVHRYLEGSGLDAGDTLLNRLQSVGKNPILPAVRTIVKDELPHVAFGSRWYRALCEAEKIDPADDFGPRIEKLRFQIPRRMEPLSVELRLRSGFTMDELNFLEEFRSTLTKTPPKPTLVLPLSEKPHLLPLFE